MKKILLSPKKGSKLGTNYALISDIDYKKVSKHCWSIVVCKNTKYVRTVINGKHIKMHRFIMGVTNKNVFIDHKDHNTLNNQRRNLRVCSNSENQKNRIPRGVSKYLGVNKMPFDIKKPWRCSIKVNGAYITSYHETEIKAAIAYDKLAKKHHKRFANLNFK